jgi:hypothetical protein
MPLAALVSVVNYPRLALTQRKAIETAEIEDRIERLEQASKEQRK